MKSDEPVYLISVAARLCNVHPQTLRQYERLGLVQPTRLNDKNRLYSERDLERIRQIQRLTQDLGVNLAGVEVILKLLDQFEEVREDMEEQVSAYLVEAERRVAHLLRNSNVPARRDETLLPSPRIRIRKRMGF